eukprot:m.209221 g.209221  ORF g.209221 m.209221 type:complete len:185 (+) comp25446_c0_seq3:292-846(+)
MEPTPCDRPLDLELVWPSAEGLDKKGDGGAWGGAGKVRRGISRDAVQSGLDGASDAAPRSSKRRRGLPINPGSTFSASLGVALTAVRRAVCPEHRPSERSSSMRMKRSAVSEEAGGEDCTYAFMQHPSKRARDENPRPVAEREDRLPFEANVCEDSKSTAGDPEKDFSCSWATYMLARIYEGDE